MEATPDLSPEQRADLVAYLDGELNESRTREVEQLLAQSSAARNEVDLLTRTWDLLELLPQEKASEQFTERTLRAIQTRSRSASGSAGLVCGIVPRPVRIAGYWIALAGLSGLGFWLTYRPVDTPEEMLEHRPVLEEMETYREIGSVEFLDAVRENELFEPEAD